MAGKSSAVRRDANTGRFVDLRSDSKAFIKAAKKYTQIVTSSPAAARESLVRAGIVTKDGKLTAKYKK